MIKSWIPSFGIPSKETRYGDTQVFVDTENNICFVIDGGCEKNTDRLISYLKSNNFNKVYLVISHAHYDHTYGIERIINDNYFTVVKLYCYDPKTLESGLRNNKGSKEVRSDIASLNNIISKAKAKQIPVEFLKHGDKVQVGDIKFKVYREQPSRVEDSDTQGWAYMNDGSLCFYFYELLYWTSGDGPDAIYNLIKKLGIQVKFFKIPHHGNNCTQSQAKGLKSQGANLCWYNDLEPKGIGTNDFTLYGARRCKEAGIMVLNCIGSDIQMTFAAKKATITKGSSTWSYDIPYGGECAEGWVKNIKGLWYRFKDGTWAVGWKKLKWEKGTDWFYFDKEGYMVTGWQYLQWSKGKDWFYFDRTTGVMLTGWQELQWSQGTDWFYLDPICGNMITGWAKITDRFGNRDAWFFFDKSTGAMRKGWVPDNDSWYWFNKTSGELATGWLEENGRMYYLEPNANNNLGHAYKNMTAVIDDEVWVFDGGCHATKKSSSIPTIKFTTGQIVIDISQFNNVTNWAAVKQTGYPVIIRIGYRGSKTGVITYDPKYKEYRTACEKHGIPHSFYFFPCSITVEEAKEEASFIKREVQNSLFSMPIYLDSEVVQRDKSGRSDKLSKEKRTQMLRIICEQLLNVGIPCGVYASRSWLYNNLDMSKIPAAAAKNTWVAQYGVSQHAYNGEYVMWQYTSKGSINGIEGNVDLSYIQGNFYMSEYKPPVVQPSKTNTVSELELVLKTAQKEIGYLEKKSNSQLDNKTANAGYNNYTKYWRDIYNWCGKNYQGQPWCAAFVTWVFSTALNPPRAEQLLKHFPYIYCPTMKKLFTLNANPKVGDIVIFYRNGVFAHTGIVTAVNGDQFSTIEGNTSGASGIVDNGGGVCKKTYYNSKLPGTKFCTPNYNSTAIINSQTTVVADDMHTVKWNGIVKSTSPLNVRLQPKLDAKTCSFSPLKNGTEVGVCYETGNWYLIKYNGKWGYVYADYIVKK